MCLAALLNLERCTSCAAAGREDDADDEDDEDEDDDEAKERVETLPSEASLRLNVICSLLSALLLLPPPPALPPLAACCCSLRKALMTLKNSSVRSRHDLRTSIFFLWLLLTSSSTVRKIKGGKKGATFWC